MRRTVLLLLLFSFISQAIWAQPSQAEINKMIKQANDAMKEYGSDSTVNKAIKDAQNKQGAGNSGSTGSLYTSDPGSYGNVDNWKFPPKNTALLSSLPKKILTRQELVSFLNDTYLQVSKKNPAEINSSVQSILKKYNNDGNSMGDAAITGWYTDYRQESLLLIIKAAIANPDNGVLLNNCAAVLNMSGIEQKAIPILKHVLQSYPDNSMLLNNLGQAYAGLGDTDTAMHYLGRCLKIEPENPEACNTAGQIEATKGNKGKAIEYFEKSIKQAYTKTAALKLRKIKKDAKLAPLIRPRVKLPEYFNLFKYDLPAQCTSTDNAALARAEQNAFRNMISKQMQYFGAKYAELAQQEKQKAMAIMNANGKGRVLRKDEFIAQPYYELCQIMAGEVLSDYKRDLADLSKRVTKNYTEAMGLLEQEYSIKRKALQDASAECPSFNALANQYLPKFAELTVDWQEKYKVVFQRYFDELVYWHYLSLNPANENTFKMQYYVFIEQYLAGMGGICNTKIIDPCEVTPMNTTKDPNEIGEPDCPIDIELGFGVGKFELNCEKFSFNAGEGVIFGYEKRFKTKQSTVSLGIGFKLDLGIKAGGTGVKVGAGLTESLFITFDGDNKFADGGIKMDAKVSAGASVAGVKTNEKVGVGYTFGINSGCNFNEGPFK
ncbi:MAG: tetratricopeptide repeat protein [Chitinophagaceae bacterium]